MNVLDHSSGLAGCTMISKSLKTLKKKIKLHYIPIIQFPLRENKIMQTTKNNKNPKSMKNNKQQKLKAENKRR